MESLGIGPAFWRGKRVLVTGHTGFKGSWLCLLLQRLGAEIAGYALDPPSRPSLFEAARVFEGLEHEHGDVVDFERMTALMREHRAEIVFHLAAQSLVRRSYEKPLETYRTNVLGTAGMLEALRHNPGVRAAVIVTSDKCYDLSVARERYREDDTLGGHDPYSASKAAAELVAMAYRTSFWERDKQAPGPRMATARSGNVVGGGDWSRDRLLPDLLSSFSNDTPALIRNPDAVRPWQHVLDPLRGYLMLAERLAGDNGMDFAGAWNFGPPDRSEWPVSAVADLVARSFGGRAEWKLDPGQHPHEAFSLRLDSSKAATRLGWRGQIPLRVALEHTVRFHKAFASGADARVLVNADIDELALHAVSP